MSAKFTDKKPNRLTSLYGPVWSYWENKDNRKYPEYRENWGNREYEKYMASRKNLKCAWI